MIDVFIETYSTIFIFGLGVATGTMFDKYERKENEFALALFITLFWPIIAVLRIGMLTHTLAAKYVSQWSKVYYEGLVKDIEKSEEDW
jgi:uncharacterized membrane protein YoaK (UPF0700 family)